MHGFYSIAKVSIGEETGPQIHLGISEVVQKEDDGTEFEIISCALMFLKTSDNM